jgi:hypothetical protein
VAKRLLRSPPSHGTPSRLSGRGKGATLWRSLRIDPPDTSRTRMGRRCKDPRPRVGDRRPAGLCHGTRRGLCSRSTRARCGPRRRLGGDRRRHVHRCGRRVPSRWESWGFRSIPSPTLPTRPSRAPRSDRAPGPSFIQWNANRPAWGRQGERVSPAASRQIVKYPGRPSFPAQVSGGRTLVAVAPAPRVRSRAARLEPRRLHRLR